MLSLRPALIADVFDPTDPETEALGAERRRELLAALRQLPDAQRRAVVCRYLLELSEDETATVLGRPVGTVKPPLAPSAVPAA